jgi:hypothetical protein
MTVTPSGCIRLPAQTLRTTLAACDAFQSFVDAADADAALLRIHEDGVLPPDDMKEFRVEELNALRPYAIIWTETIRFDADAFGVGNEFGGSGSMLIHLAENAPDGVTQASIEVTHQMTNDLGDIMDDLMDLAGTPGYLDITAMTPKELPGWGGEADAAGQGLYIAADLAVDWGSQ